MRLRQEESPISLESKNRSIVRSIRIEVYTEYLCWCSSVDVRGIKCEWYYLLEIYRRRESDTGES